MARVRVSESESESGSERENESGSENGIKDENESGCGRGHGGSLVRMRARDGEQEQQGARVATNPQLSLHGGFSSSSLWERSSSLGVVRCELDCTLNEHTHNEYGWV